MFNWLRRRRLSAAARKRLLLVAAKAEEALIETHVANIIDLLETLGDEIDIDRGIELYVEMMSLNEANAASVTNRLLSRFDDSSAAAGPGHEPGRFKNVFRNSDK
jgi:hypothetical protein